MANPFVHVELHTQTANESKDFYGKLFDWKLEDMPMENGGTYSMITVGDSGIGGGLMQHPDPNAPTMWVPYVSVDDVATYTAKAKSLGATIICEKTPVRDFGWFGIIQDPAGAIIGYWQDKK